MELPDNDDGCQQDGKDMVKGDIVADLLAES